MTHMNTLVSPTHIRQRLQAHYEPGEATWLTRIVCNEVLGQSMTDYYLGKDIVLSANKETELENILNRLCRYEPIQYIQGKARFLGRDFHVAPGVLIPRPETEELVERIVRDTPAGAHVLDIGSGSGCISVSLALAIPGGTVTAWDISTEAIDIARGNAQALGAEVRFVPCDVLAVQPDADERYDVIVSNPPYVTERERDDMEPNVLEWEPALALFVPDNDPLRFYRRIADLGHQLLTPGGRLYFEINQAYGKAMTDMLHGQGYAHARVEKDSFGKDRFVICSLDKTDPHTL